MLSCENIKKCIPPHVHGKPPFTSQTKTFEKATALKGMTGVFLYFIFHKSTSGDALGPVSHSKLESFIRLEMG